MTTHHPRRFLAGLAAAALAVATLAAAGTATADPDDDPAARARVADRTLRIELADLGRVVGPDGGGVVVEHGDPVALVTDPDDVDAVRAAGGSARLVDHTAAELDGIIAVLNRFATNRSAGRVQSWGVDVAGNRVVVTATTGARDGATRAFLARAQRFGDVVVVVRAPASVAPVTTDAVYGGQAYAYPRPGRTNGRCSVGFNAYDRSRYYVLTAGHCSVGYPATQRGGYRFGRTTAYRYPGADWGVFVNDYPGYFGPKGATWQWNGYVLRVPGAWHNPAVGTRICKSGSTTGWTCGSITALNVTANYGSGLIYGLVQHSACTEEGDSGGSVVSTGGWALGLSSGSSLHLRNGVKVCGQKVGRANNAYYQPIGPVLTATGLTLLTG